MAGSLRRALFVLVACACTLGVAYNTVPPLQDGSYNVQRQLSDGGGTRLIYGGGWETWIMFNLTSYIPGFTGNALYIPNIRFNGPNGCTGQYDPNAGRKYVYWVKDFYFNSSIETYATLSTPDVLSRMMLTDFEDNYSGNFGWLYDAVQYAMSSTGYLTLRFSTSSPTYNYSCNSMETNPNPVNVYSLTIDQQGRQTNEGTCQGCLRRCRSLHRGCGWCDTGGGSGTCMEAQIGLPPSFYTQCAGNWTTTSCDDGVKVRISSTSNSSTVYSMMPDFDFTQQSHDNLNAFTYSTAFLTTYKTSSQTYYGNRTRVYYWLDSIPRTVNTTVSFFFVPLMYVNNGNEDGRRMYLIPNPERYSPSGMTWNTQPSTTGALPVSLLPSNNYANFDDCNNRRAMAWDLSWVAKYATGSRMLLMSEYMNSGTNQVFELYGYSGGSPLQSQRPTLYSDEGQLDNTYWKIPSDLGVGWAKNCSACLNFCPAYLNSCGWCASSGLCLDGTNALHDCPDDQWHSSSCPSEPFHRVTASASSDYFLADSPNEFYTAPLFLDNGWSTQAVENLDTAYVLYMDFDISGLSGDSIANANLVINRGQSNDDDDADTNNACPGDNRCRYNPVGLWIFDLPAGTTMDTLSYGTLFKSTRTLIYSDQLNDLQLLTARRFPITSVLRMLVAKGASHVYFAITLACNDNQFITFINNRMSYFPQAWPRLDVMTGFFNDSAAVLSTLTTCSACFNNCPLPYVNCGFCTSTQQCLEGMESGPVNGTYFCPPEDWLFRECPPADSRLINQTFATVKATSSFSVSQFSPDTPGVNMPEWIVATNNINQTRYSYIQFSVDQLRDLAVQDVNIQILAPPRSWKVEVIDPDQNHAESDLYELSGGIADPSTVTFNNPPPLNRRWIIGTRPRDLPVMFGMFQYMADKNGAMFSIYNAVMRALADNHPLTLIHYGRTDKWEFEYFSSNNYLESLKPRLMVKLGTPSATTNPCRGLTTCSACLEASTNCGWCDASSVCMFGTESGPAQSSCPSYAWVIDQCPVNYFTSQPYTHHAWLYAYNSTTIAASNNQPAASQPISDVMPDGPMLPGGSWRLTQNYYVGLLFDYGALPPPIDIANVTRQYFYLSASRAFFEWGMSPNYLGLNINRKQVSFNPAQFTTGVWSQGSSTIDNTAKYNTDPSVLSDNYVLYVANYNDLPLPPTYLQPGNLGMAVSVSINNAQNNQVAWIGGHASATTSERPRILVQALVNLTLPDCTVATLQSPCACLGMPHCAWCTNTSSCVNGGSAAQCAATPGQLFKYLVPCVPPYSGKYGGELPNTTDTDCQCALCPGGTFATQFACTPCQPGYYSADLLTPCAPCATGTYQPQAGQTTCLTCPESASCTGEGLVNPNGVGSGYGGCCTPGLTGTRCALAEACLGGPCNCPFSNCAPGYEGDFCDLCSKTPLPYHRVNGRCQPCPQLAPLFIAIAIVAVVLLCVVLLKYGRTISRYLTSLSIGLAFIQSVGLFRYFAFKLPPELLAYINVLSVSNLDPNIFNTECAFPSIDYYTGFALRMTLPLVVLAFFATCYMVVWIHAKIVARCVVSFRTNHQRFVRDRDRSLKGCAKFQDWCRWQLVRFTTHYLSKLELSAYKSRIISAYVTFLVLAYLFTTQTALEVFACVPDSVGQYRVASDPSVPCSGGAYSDLRAAAIVCILFYTAGLPLVFFLILFQNRVYAQLGDEKFLLRYGMLFSRYKPGRFYWEVVIMIRKFLIVACAIFAPALTPNYGTALILIFAIILSLALQLVLKLFKFIQHNILETSLMVLYLLSVMTGAITLGVNGDRQTMSVFLFIFLSIGLLLTIGIFAFDIVDMTIKLVARSPRLQALLLRRKWQVGDENEGKGDGEDSIELSSTKSLPPTPPQRRPSGGTAALTPAATAATQDGKGSLRGAPQRHGSSAAELAAFDASGDPSANPVFGSGDSAALPPSPRTSPLPPVAVAAATATPPAAEVQRPPSPRAAPLPPGAAPAATPAEPATGAASPGPPRRPTVLAKALPEMPPA